ncbi:MAG: dienelactone hydrolase family protein, partial [Chloroflexi bacterium]
MGENVTFKADGGTTNGYLAKPASGKGPGVVVIQ